MGMETGTKKRYLDHNIRRIDNFVQLPPLDVFALTLVKHGVLSLVPLTIIFFLTSNH
jgi:hypothetical protein